jgi:hypothetical protein
MVRSITVVTGLALESRLLLLLMAVQPRYMGEQSEIQNHYTTWMVRDRKGQHDAEILPVEGYYQ